MAKEEKENSEKEKWMEGFFIVLYTNPVPQNGIYASEVDKIMTQTT